jgi:hypothetical protein
MIDISKVYRADGDIFGYLWGGGVASYPTGLPLFRAGSLEELRASIQAAIDAEHHRFGDFEALIGAVMDITTVEIITIDGKRYFREESEIKIFFHPRIIPCDYEKWTETFRQILES